MADVAKHVQEPSVQIAAPDANSKRSRKRKHKSRAQIYKAKQPRPDYQPIVKHNDHLIKYYKAQTIFEPAEFDTFLEGLKETLPASFRINTFDGAQADFLRRLVEQSDFDQLIVEPPACEQHANQSLQQQQQQQQTNECKKEAPSEEQPPADQQQDESNKSDSPTNSPARAEAADVAALLEPLGWYPKRLAWQMNITRLDLRKSPALQQLHKFLMAETDNGFISRQEAVSMLPPLVLDVRHGQNILDMCAAPGSKTAQLLEYLKCDVMAPAELRAAKSSDDRDPFDDGLVVANDVDNKRCYMLVHQSSRLNSPNCIIINQDAARLPDLKTLAEDGSFVSIKFDRILCDVPCSGDGTVRKNPDVWKKWSVGNANNFHGMQCKILKRGVELLKENGLLVYSTCSMNPIEDEAVIASILRASQGALVLEEVAHKLPGLKYRPGVTQWTVMNREAEVMLSPDQVPAENLTQIYPSLFKPTVEESRQFELHKCIRILPHFQNTGGFFVAVLKKLKPTLPWEEVGQLTGDPAASATQSSASVSKPTDEIPKEAQQQPPPNPKKRRYAGFKEDPFVFMDPLDSDWLSIKKVYGMSANFPLNQLVHRCTSGKKRSIYLVSKRTRSFIIANREEPSRKEFVKIINAGMRLFSRADTEAGFRICQDGVNEVLPFIKDDIKVPLSEVDLIALLKARTVPIEKLSSANCVRDKIKQGSFIFIYKHEPSGDGETRQQAFEMPLVAWRGEWTVALYVSNTYRVHLCALAKLRTSDLNGIVKQETTLLQQQ